jgi:heme iron utilization protein
VVARLAHNQEVAGSNPAPGILQIALKRGKIMFAFLAVLAMFVGGDTETADAMTKLAKSGTIVTLSSDYKGTPFGTPAPYALDAEGRPVLLLSDLAVHTKNLKANPKCSVMLLKEDKEDPFNSARVTFVGKMVKVDDKERAAYKTLFLAKQKAAEDFADFGDFNYYRLEIESIFYVGGFGDINWVQPKDYLKSFKK